MEDKHIRILLDISLLKDKPHKLVWMLISTYDLKSIADLKESVIKKLSLDRNDIEMYVNGGLLLEEESILILRENDNVLIQYGNQSSLNNFSSSEIFYNSRTSDVILNSYKTDDKIERRSKKKKRKSEVSAIVIDSSMEQNSNKRKRNLNASDALENDCSKDLLEGENSANLSNVNDTSVYKAKKKKHKKSCSTSTPKDASRQNVQSNDNLFEIKDATTSWDVKEISNLVKDNHVKESPALSSKDDVFAEKSLNGNNTNLSMNISDCKEERKSHKNKPHSPSNKILIQNDTGKSNIIPNNDSIKDPGNNSQSDITEPFVQSNNCKKKKRRRHRKRKSIEQNLVAPFMSEDMNSSSSQKKDDPLIFTPCDNFAGIRKHIRFTSPDLDSKKNDININLSNQSSKEDVLIKTEPKEKCMSGMAEMDESITKSNGKVNSPRKNEPSPRKTDNNSLVVSTLNSKHENGFSQQNTVSKSKVSEKAKNYSNPSYEDCPVLNSLPCIGTCIAFKLLELNEYYSPEVSSYKKGILKAINPKTGDMEIELTQVEVKPGRIGKFENLKEDEIPPEEIVQKVTASWTSLIDPRLVPHC